jgi:two-component system, OmpR family, KDP operon response regulator KdpE
MHRILIVEDDPAIRKILTILFETKSFRVVAAETCEQGIRDAQTYRPDICVLDLGLPDRDGISFIRQVRTWSSMPIIVLTARTQEAQRLSAFDAGVDDYVVKPFSGPELLARVRAIVRRAARADRPNVIIKFGDISIDLGNRVTVGPNGEAVKLTPLEHRILECLVRHADGVVTHAQLLKEVWGPHQADVRSLRVYVASLRRKLELDPARPRHIVTEPGMGYRLVTEPDSNGALVES